MLSLLSATLHDIEDGGSFFQGLRCPLNRFARRTATHPQSAAELQEDLALGSMLAGLRVVAGRRAVFQGSLLDLCLARYVWTDTVSFRKGLRTGI